MKNPVNPKLLKRFLLGLLNTMRSMVGRMSNLIIAWLVISMESEGLWGGFVQDLILLGLVVHILGWGNKEYLLRAFSKDPAQLSKLYYRIFSTRLPLLFIPCILILFIYPLHLWLPIILWLLGAFWKDSLQVWIVYHRRFAWAGVSEILGLGISLLILLSQDTIDRALLIWIFCISTWMTTGLLLLILKPGKPFLSFNWAFFSQSAPFFFIALSGMLASKIDLYTVNFLLEDTLVGVYQIVVGMFILLPAATAFLIEPFIKNLYRVQDAVFRKMARKIILLGLGIVAGLFPFIYLIFHYFYPFSLSLEVYLFGLCYIIPGIINFPRIYLLFKSGKEKTVMWINFIHFAINMILALVLIPQMGMEGAFLAKAIAATCATIMIYSQSATPKLSGE